MIKIPVICGKAGKQLQVATKPVKRKAGQRANLTRQAIIAMACQMLEAGRPVNVLKLAQALSVVPATIKSHYPGGLEEISADIARSVLAGIARPFQPGETATAYLNGLFMRLLERLHGRPPVARFVANHLLENHVLEPHLAERLLQCAASLGIERDRCMMAVRRIIGRLCEMVFAECALPDESLAAAIIRQIPAHEFPMLTETAADIAGPPRQRVAFNPEGAKAYADDTIALLRRLARRERKSR